jgi:hypothetical protein
MVHRERAPAFLIVVLILLLSAGRGGAGPQDAGSGPTLRKVTLPGRSWSLVLDLPGFEFTAEDTSGGAGRRRIFGDNLETGIGISITLQEEGKTVDPRGARDRFWDTVRSDHRKRRHVSRSDREGMAIVEFIVPRLDKNRVDEKNVHAFLTHEGASIHIHLMKVGYRDEDAPRFESILASASILSSETAPESRRAAAAAPEPVSGTERVREPVADREPPAPSAGDAEIRIRSAISALRDHNAEGLTEEAKRALGRRLDDAWDVMEKHRDLARRIVREILVGETRDSFLIIDLCDYLLSTDPGSPDLADLSRHLMRSDPNVYSHGYFKLASLMAAHRCESCRPAVLKMLELRSLDAYISLHALRVEIDLGLVFTISQYGDSIVPDVFDRLEDPDCHVRGNAARALGNLLPLRELPELRSMARADPCPEARAGAWMGLTLLKDRAVESLAAERLRVRETLHPLDKQHIPLALASAGTGTARSRLEELAQDSDPELARWARESLDAAPIRPEIAVGSRSGRKRAAAVKMLEEIVRKGRAEKEPDGEELIRSLTPEDLPLVNRARAAVLPRLSDECLYEYYPMSFAAARLRLAALDSSLSGGLP